MNYQTKLSVDNSEVAINAIKSNKIRNYIFYNLNENKFKLINNPINKQISQNFDNKKDDQILIS